MKSVLSASLIFVALSTIPALAARVTLTGEVTDTLCGGHHMFPQTTPADCTRACVTRGANFALAVGDQVYILQGRYAQLYKLAGTQITVTGELNANVLSIESITPANITPAK